MALAQWGTGMLWLGQGSVPRGAQTQPDTHICIQVALQEVGSPQNEPPEPPWLPKPKHKSPPGCCQPQRAPGVALSSTLCGAANSSELNQCWGRIAKLPEMDPKKNRPSHYAL